MCGSSPDLEKTVVLRKEKLAVEDGDELD